METIQICLIFPHRENFPYFRADDDRWKNSVRHNLSMNPHFRKGTKSRHGAGHVWVLADEGAAGQLSAPPKLISNEVEAAEAVRSILSGVGGAGERGLQRAAGEILAGVKRPTAVEQSCTLVQFLLPERGGEQCPPSYQVYCEPAALASLDQVPTK